MEFCVIMISWHPNSWVKTHLKEKETFPSKSKMPHVSFISSDSDVDVKHSHSTRNGMHYY